MPVLLFHVTSDPYVALLNATQTITQFAQLNGLGDNGIDNDSITTDPIAAGRGVNFAWLRYSFGQSYFVDMGHSWAGGDPQFPNADTRGPDETAIMWGFLRQYARVTKRRRAVRSGMRARPSLLSMEGNDMASTYSGTVVDEWETRWRSDGDGDKHQPQQGSGDDHHLDIGAQSWAAPHDRCLGTEQIPRSTQIGERGGKSMEKLSEGAAA